ncbi:MAG TPA: hypothetical protein VFU43_04040 [Streptosporangiaceae bacterium]|nr:hypothetical protein [Streptosporangiaceae bacterium]
MRDEQKLAVELRWATKRQLVNVFKRPDGSDEREDFRVLARICKEVEKEIWKRDRPGALIAVMRAAILRLPETLAPDCVTSWQHIGQTLCGFREDLDLREDGQSHDYDYYRKIALAESEFPKTDKTFRTNITGGCRKLLAQILLKMEAEIVAAAASAVTSAEDSEPAAALRAEPNVRIASVLKDSQWARELLAVSTAYVRDIRIDADLHVVRTLEPDLLEALRNTSRPWPRAVVGEAGSGKSALLWSLHQRLDTHPDMQPVLLPATWLLRGRNDEPAEKLVGLFQEIARAGSTPVLLLDTADLMLHNEKARQTLLRLLDAVYVGGFAGLYSTRPQEAVLLSHDELRRHDLQLYDDAELDHAVTALVAHYCPDVPVAEVTRRVRHATARGLPVAEVCRSPLLLRMLFDLSAPAEPELGDVDLPRLFDAYWQRRVVRDARTDAEIGLRARATENLSAMAGYAAVGLLASGLPELPAATLRDTTATAAQSDGDRAPLEEGLAILTERGVLVPSGEHLGFFHQTMFEFAAAKGLLARSDPATIGTLASRATSHGGDLFVGTVLEQVLILAGTNPLLHAAAQAAIKALTTSDSEAIQAIGLVAWGHHPALLDRPADALRTAGPLALERAARILPTIAAKPTGQTISQLILIWQSTTDPQARTMVLDAFARLALRAPQDVADALTYLEPPLQAFAGATVTHAMRHSLFRLLKKISSQAHLLVRSTLVAMLMNSDGGASIELDYLADQWPHIGDDHLLTEIVLILDDDGPPNGIIALGLGKIIAAEWHRTGIWDDTDAWAGFLAHATDPGPINVTLQSEAILRAIGAFVVTTDDDGRIRLAIEALLDAPDPHVRDSACQSVLGFILWSVGDLFVLLPGRSDAAATILNGIVKTSLATIGYAAQQGVIDDRQQLFLDLLTQTRLPKGLLARLLPPHLESQDWTADARLLRIAPAAADHGHHSAQRFLERVSRTPQMLSTAQLDALFSTQGVHAPRTDEVFDAIVSIATQTGRTADLTKIVNSADLHDRRIDKHSPALLTHTRELLAGTDESKRRGSQFLAELMAKIDTEMAWPELRALLNDVDDPQILVKLIPILCGPTFTGDVSAQLDYLGQFISVQPNAERPVTRPPGRPTEISVAAVSARVMLYILGFRAEATTDHWPQVRTLGLYQVEENEIIVDGSGFLIVCHYLARLGQTNSRQVGSNLLDYLTALASGEFRGVTLPALLWRRELGNAVQHACAHGDHKTIESLIATCATIDNSIAEVITTAIAERHYADAREHIRTLSHSDITSTLRSFLLDLIRTYDRSFGTRAFPEILSTATG